MRMTASWFRSLSGIDRIQGRGARSSHHPEQARLDRLVVLLANGPVDYSAVDPDAPEPAARARSGQGVAWK